MNNANTHSHLPVPAMDDEMPASPAVLAIATTVGNVTPEVVAMDGDTLSMSSPFTASPSPVQPVRVAHKRGSPVGTPRSSRAASPTARWSSRESSPARFIGPARAVHRRTEPGSEAGPTGTAGRFVQPDEQARLDHEYMDNLSMDLEGVMNLSASNELSVKWLRRTVDKQAKDMISMQTDFMKHLDEAKQKNVQDKAHMYHEFGDELERTKGQISKSIGEEICDTALFAKHLVGHDEPVLEPLVVPMIDEQVRVLHEQVKNLNDWVQEKITRDAKV